VIRDSNPANKRQNYFNTLNYMGELGDSILEELYDQMLDPLAFNRQYKNRPECWEEFHIYGHLLKAFPNEAILKKMVDVLADPSPVCSASDNNMLRRYLIRGLGASGASEAVPAIAPYIAKDNKINDEALDALAAIGDMSSVSILTDRIKGTKDILDERYLKTLQKIDPNIAWQCIIEGLDSENPAPLWTVQAVGSMWKELTKGHIQALFDYALNLPIHEESDRILSRYASNLWEMVQRNRDPDFENILDKLSAIRDRLCKAENCTRIHSWIKHVAQRGNLQSGNQ
jgi:hypothetical protein